MPRLKKSTDANGVVFYPITISKGVYDTDRNQRLSETLAAIYSQLNSLTAAYTDVYIGRGVNYTTAMVAGNHHDGMARGEHVSLTCNNSKIWIILQEDNPTPLLMMNGLEIPLSRESDVTDDGVTYRVYASSNTYSGTFNVLIF